MGLYHEGDNIMAEAKKATSKKKLATSEKLEVAELETGNKKLETEPTAKSGKRSAKAVKEVEEKEAKEERKATKAEKSDEDKPKPKQNPPRTKLQRKSKAYRKVAELVDTNKEYSLKEALELATKTNPVKFDAAVEMHIKLGVDPRHADQNLRDIVVLPAGTGKKICIAVFADIDDAAIAKKAGADIAGEEDVQKLLDKGTFNFDVLIATPTMMAKLGKYARALGPKGLMPNPKSGTVTTDVAKAVTEAKAGRVEYRVDSTGIVHLSVGKVSFGGENLLKNAQAVTASIKAAKPPSLKGAYVKAIFVTTTMGPSIKVETAAIG
jgi:large subunit ribosomal protein L1